VRFVETALVLMFGLGLAYFAFTTFGDDRAVGAAAAALVLTLFLGLAYGLDQGSRR
jgi:hypothetical protein